MCINKENRTLINKLVQENKRYKNHKHKKIENNKKAYDNVNAMLPYIGTQVPSNITNKLVRGILESVLEQVIQWINPNIVSQEAHAI